MNDFAKNKSTKLALENMIYRYVMVRVTHKLEMERENMWLYPNDSTSKCIIIKKTNTSGSKRPGYWVIHVPRVENV